MGIESSMDTVSACNKGGEIEITHPVTGKGIGLFISILGNDSDVVTEYLSEKQDKREREAAYAKKRGKEPELRTSEVRKQENLELLAVCTTGWRTVGADGVSEPTAEFNDKKHEYSIPNAIALYKKFPSIYEQVNAGISQLENFMPV